MFSIRYFLLCLVALSTNIVSALPVTPSSSTLHNLLGSETPTGTLVSRQESNPQRQLFCHYNPLDCQRDFPEYCTDMIKPSPDWCDVVATPVAQLDARVSDLPIDDHTLVSRQETPEELRKALRFCAKSPGYCESLCDTNLGFCDRVTCRYDPLRCRELFGIRCTKWSGPWWCRSEVPPPPGEEETTIIVEREVSGSNDAREAFCRYNPAECRKKWSSQCIGNKEDVPSWCDPEAAPPASEEETANIVERSPQDDPEKEDPEEHEEPHPIERPWCKKHPNHPYCYSQFCRDHPGSCKVVVDSAAIPPPPPPALTTVPATVNKGNTQSPYKRGGWWCLWLCD